MFRRILVFLDATASSERTIPIAARLARASGGSVVLARVVLPPIEAGKYTRQHSVAWERHVYERQHAQAASYLAGVMLTHAADLTGIDTELEVVTGIPAQAIFSAARHEQADLIIMCNHGEKGLKRWLFGNMAHEAVRHSPVPVLLLHERRATLPMRRSARPFRALLALDGSSFAETALEPAITLLRSLASPAPVELHLLGVVDLPATHGRWRSEAHVDIVMQEQARQKVETYLKTVIHRLQAERRSGLTITATVATSPDVAGAIARQAESPADTCCYDLLAMAAPEHHLLHRLLMGSVPEQVLDATHLPLLLTRWQAIPHLPVLK